MPAPRSRRRRVARGARWRAPSLPRERWTLSAPPPPVLWTIRPDVAGPLASYASQLAGVLDAWTAGAFGPVERGSADAVRLEGDLAALVSLAGRVGNSSSAWAAARDAMDYARAALYGTSPADPSRAVAPSARHLYARRALGELAALRLACHAAPPMPPALDARGAAVGFR